MKVKLTNHAKEVRRYSAIILGIGLLAGNPVNEAFAVPLRSKKMLLLEDIAVRGTIRDKTGPLPGVTVTLKADPSKKAVSNAEGNYSITVPKDGILVFSFVGYETVEQPVNGKATLNILMGESSTSLNEVVVIGYGSKQRQFLTGAVATVGSEIIESKPVTNAISALQGEVPGLTIQRSSGQPGTEGFELNVRGYSSTNGGNSPMVLIDGVSGSIDLLNPNDIESISVLKDASASIYGARAANGVIIVTTKKGKSGAPKITYNTNFASSKMTGMMESPTNLEMALMDNEANMHNGAAPMYTEDYLNRIRNNDPNPVDHPLYGGWKLFFTNTNWTEAIMEKGFQQQHNINVSGGGENSSYYLSGGFSDQQGVIKYADDGNQRYNLRLNYDYDFSKKIRLETKVSLENQRRTDLGGLGSWVLTEATFGMPNHPVYNADGQYFAQGGWGNALAQAQGAETAVYNKRNLNTNFKLSAELLKDLKLNLQTGINFTSDDNKDIAKSVPLYNWDGDLAYYTIANPGESSVAPFSAEKTYRNFTGYFQYNKSFGKHDLDIMGGASHEENDYEWFSARRDNFPSEDVWSINLGSSDNWSNGGGGDQWAISSLFSRIGYVFDNKYMLEGNLRYDGSSKFAANSRWGLFPSISAGWRISQENFFQGVDFVNDLKLRASYGQTGNQEEGVVGNYDYIQLINIGRVWPDQSYYPFGAGRPVQSAYLNGMKVSDDRTWETLINRNIGIDASMFNSKLSFSFDYFVKTNRNMLIPVTYPSVIGATPPFSNSGELKTWGFESSLGYRNKSGIFDYSVRLLMSDSQNKIVDYGGGDTYVPGLNKVREGYPVNTYFAYEFDGLIRSQQELDAYKQLGGVPEDIGIGDARFKDLNGDGVISAYGDNNDGDVRNVGSITPRYTYGLNLDTKVKNFDFGIFLQGVGKRTMFREGEYSMPWSDWWRQPARFYFGQTWNEDRPNAEMPKLSHGNIRYWNYQPSTLQKIDGAYVRLKNIQVGYTLPTSLMNKVSVSRARIYFSGQDLWEKHNVKGGWDPESNQWGFNYPFQRIYSFGLDVTF
ncbi:TonB-dependent receptor [Flavihumibacter sp. R14]|nr:TonB-dependent receptor [Flavihumibacter soli]